MADAIYNIITGIVGLIGIWAFLGLMNVYIPIRRVSGKKEASKSDDPYKAAGWGITAFQFNLIRYIVYAFTAAMIMRNYTMTQQLSPVVVVLFIAFICVTIPTMPKISIIPVLLRASARTRAKKLNNEVLLCFIHLKNLSLIQADLNAYEIMRKLLRQTKDLKPYLADVAKSWHVPDARQRALKRFEDTVGTSDAANLVKLLTKLDSSNIYDLQDEINHREKEYFETRQTARERRNGQLGDLFFSLATFEFMAVLFNFVLVVVFASINLDFK